MTDPTCKNCGISLVWAKPYVKGNPPVNPDGTKHICDAPAPSRNAEPRGHATPRVEVPIEQIVAEIIAVKGTMATTNLMTNAHPDGTVETQGGETIIPAPMSPEMVEGIWKFAISRKMSR